ncbi:collagen binding domain-containing protein [Coprobacillus cateniformis]|uniref:MSCRAMM family protein n=1 Tax=Coprobacillus cateniformis TaxID=100884 RepID=UPI0039A3BDF0
MIKKNIFQKVTSVILSLLIGISLIQIGGISDVKAVTLYPEATSRVSSSWLTVDMSGTALGGTAYYNSLTLNGSTAFCLDKGKKLQTGVKFARVSSKTNSMYNRVWNYWSSQGGGLTGENSAFAQGMFWALSEGVSTSNYSAYGKILGRTLEGVYGLNPYPTSQMESWAEQALTFNNTSGTLYMYDSGISSHQRLLTSIPGDLPEYLERNVTSTKSYKTTESIKVRVNKNDVDTSNKLGGVTFDFYKDDIKGGSAVTNSSGIAEHTFTTEFTKTATSTKKYISNYDDLSIPNQEKVTGYTSKADAQAAADKEALEKAKELAEAGSGQEHTYKVIETATKTNYWLNPATGTYEKKHTGSGTVEFNIGNKRQVGSITLIKRDSETNNLVDNAICGLYARSPIIHPDGKTGILFNANDLVATFPKTAVNGTAVLNNLYLGQYYVAEITAPPGYLRSNKKYNVDLTYAGQNVQVTDASTTVKNKVQRAEIHSIKEDKELDTGSKDKNVFDFNKDRAQGDATRVGATYGLYADEPIIHHDGTTGIVQYNQVKDSIHELKSVKGTDLQVKNVKANAGTLLATIKTDNNGEFGFSHLYNGKYFIQEIEPSEGYTLDPTKYYIDLSYTNQNQEVIIKNQKVLEVVKKQAFDLFKAGHVPGTSTNAKPLENVEFTVWLESDIQSFINKGKTLAEAKQLAPVYDKLVTKADGRDESIELPFGKYRISETKPAPDYAYAEDFFVIITEDSRVHQSWTNNVIIDELFTGLFEAVKLDRESGKQVKLEGARFQIRNTDTGEYFGYWEWLPFPRYVNSWTTNSEGYVRLQEKLSAGHYELIEIEPPFGYVLDSSPIPFKISSDNMYQMAEDGKTPVIRAYKENVSVKGKIKLYKEGEVLTGYDEKEKNFIYEKIGLANAVYDILAEKDILDPCNDKTVLYHAGEVVDTITTNEDGQAESKLLPLGDYEVKEKESPSGFVLNNEVKKVSLTYEDKETEIVYEDVEFYNERQKVEIETSKQDSDTQDYVEGAELTLKANRDIYNYKGDVIVKAGTLLETVVSNSKGKVKFVTDLPNDLTPKDGVMPIDDDLNNDIDHEFSQTVVDGVRLIGDPNSLFMVYESKEPVGYIPYKLNYYIDTSYTNQNSSILKFETPFFNDITVTEILKTNGSELIKGAHMQILDEKGKIYDEWISDGTSHMSKGLPLDKELILHEVEPPHGYTLADDIKFIVRDYQKIEMIDKPIVRFRKLDSDSKIFVKGVHMQIIEKETDKTVYDFITDDKAMNFVFDYGKTYIAREVETVEGYYKNDKDIEFIATPNLTVDFYNSPILTRLQVNKIDKDTKELIVNNPFTFAVFADKNCTHLLDILETDSNKGIALSKIVLRYGKVYLKEIKGPNGYKINHNVIEININDDLEGVGDTHVIDIENEKITEPSIVITDDTVSSFAYFAGLLMVSGMIFIVMKRKKKEK